MRSVVLSERLQALANMVTPGMEVVDVGCDHGFLPIFLVQNGISPHVLAMDVRTGPLSRAEEHILEYELSEYIETRLSDGLREYKKDEARSMVCAGMGGPLMQKILTESMEKAKSLEELILQPQSELADFRKFLADAEFGLLEENILCEEGKYYFLMKVSPGCEEADVCAGTGLPRELCERFGPLLLEQRHPVLKAYLEERRTATEQIAVSLRGASGERAEIRLGEVEQELKFIQQALELF